MFVGAGLSVFARPFRVEFARKLWRSSARSAPATTLFAAAFGRLYGRSLVFALAAAFLCLCLRIGWNCWRGVGLGAEALGDRIGHLLLPKPLNVPVDSRDQSLVGPVAAAVLWQALIGADVEGDPLVVADRLVVPGLQKAGQGHLFEPCKPLVPLNLKSLQVVIDHLELLNVREPVVLDHLGVRRVVPHDHPE